MIDITQCPECGEPAEVEWRDTLESTDGPVEHAKVRCLQRHSFLLPVSMLRSHEPNRATAETVSSPGRTPRDLAV